MNWNSKFTKEIRSITKMTNAVSILCILCVLCRTGWSVTDDDVAILVTSLTTRPTTIRPSVNRNTIPRHPFLYKKDYKDWLGLKTGIYTYSNLSTTVVRPLPYFRLHLYIFLFQSFSSGYQVDDVRGPFFSSFSIRQKISIFLLPADDIMIDR